MRNEKLYKEVLPHLNSKTSVNKTEFSKWLKANIGQINFFRDLSESEQLFEFALTKYNLEEVSSRHDKFNQLYVEIEKFKASELRTLSTKRRNTTKERLGLRAAIVEEMDGNINITAKELTALLEKRFKREGWQPYPDEKDVQGRSPLLRRVQEDLAHLRRTIKNNSHLRELVKLSKTNQ